MEVILRGYDVNSATWFYLSLLLIIAVFFRFTRLWSLRNLDLAMLLGLAPGLLFVREGSPTGLAWGYAYLFAATGVLLLRLFCDGLLTRRPLCEQNLNVQGLAFLCVCSFGFMMTRVVTYPPVPQTEQTVLRSRHMVERTVPVATTVTDSAEAGPASTLIAAPVGALSRTVRVAASILAILAHFAVMVALYLIGRRHFGDSQVGWAMATLYLLLPATAYDVGRVNHVLPAALILWAFVAYRSPIIAGSFMSLACGALFFPVFLLPLWCTFYGRRGAMRFCGGALATGAVLAATFARTSTDLSSFSQQVIGSINWRFLQFEGVQSAGFWSVHDPAYRIPVFAAFLIMLTMLTIWPRKKNLEHLISHSTAIVVATQFWYPVQGGVYVLWYLPLLLLVVFRPRLLNQRPPEFLQQVEQRSNPQPVTTRSAAMMTGSLPDRPMFR